ncbi:MAG: undecaprenyldiphospho-muramoylpentapeptide beta-N-acetylglucosaminyltransferase [Bacteroidota bacterium]
MRVVISGGGTGGHIFPAIAIANALRSIRPETEFLFVGAEGRMEMEKVPAAGYDIVGLPIAGIKRELSVDNLRFPFKLVRSLMKAGSVVRKFNPDVAVGVGGYASGPMLYIASRRGVPTLIQEQNSFPGITNRLLSRKASAICVAYPGMERFFPADRIVFTGNPVRKELLDTAGLRDEAFRFFGLDPSLPTLLVVGGSQGARSINQAVRSGIELLNAAGVQLIWQTGKAFLQDARKAVAPLGAKAWVDAFITRMDLAYANSDVVIGRAGASTVSELCIVRKPAILVPLPTAAEDHQTKNCKALVDQGAAILVTDDQASSRLIHDALELLRNPDRRRSLAEKLGSLARPHAAEEIAQHVIRIASSSKS